MAGIPKAATQLEQALLNKEISMENFEQAALVLDQDFAPMTDVRATSEYRLQVAQNLVQKCAFELANPDSITRIEALEKSELSLAQVTAKEVLGGEQHA